MPINIPDGLPAKETLHQERIFALEEEVANNQQIRPLRVVILNLMPTKVDRLARAGELKDGDLIALVGFGAGLDIGACLLRWK